MLFCLSDDSGIFWCLQGQAGVCESSRKGQSAYVICIGMSSDKKSAMDLGSV